MPALAFVYVQGKSIKKAIIKSVVIALLSVAGSAQAGPYASMVIFGDSLSDSGNNALAMGATVSGATFITPLLNTAA